MSKPFSQACENNRQPILDVIKTYFSDAKQVLEIGSGTGQHAVFFASKLPHLFWQTSDQPQYHFGINAWIDDCSLKNIGRPIQLNVLDSTWPNDPIEHVFSANTSHIMSWKMVEAFFEGVGTRLSKEGYFCLYGPFNFDNQFTSESNRAFNQHLQQQDPDMGIRNFEDLMDLALQNNLSFVEKHALPANNFILVWQAQ